MDLNSESNITVANNNYGTSSSPTPVSTTSHETHNFNSNNEKLRIADLSPSSLKSDFETSDMKNLSEGVGSNQAKMNVFRKWAIAVSWISIIATLAISIFEFVVSENENSSASFGLAFSAILDVLSSAVVVWRFYKAFDTFSRRREHTSCIVLAALFIISALGIAGRAIYSLHRGMAADAKTASEYREIVTYSVVVVCLCSFLFCVKFVLSRKLSSAALLTDALNSLAGAVIALSIVITSEVTKHNKHLWYLDSSVGLVVSLLLLGYGCWLLYKHVPAVRHT